MIPCLYISLGSECDTKYQIAKYLKKYNIEQETFFFDWLVTDFNTVNKVLSTGIEFIKKENMIETRKKGNLSVFEINNVSKFISMHDIPDKYNDQDLENFIDKYKRRYEKLINIIKSNEKIYFIRKGNFTIEQITLFFKNINDINPNNDIYLILINNFNNIPLYIKKNKTLYINLEKFKIKNKENNDWTGSEYYWHLIFKIINHVFIV